MRTERARAAMNQACGAQTFMRTPQELKELVPQLDLTGGGRYPVLGGSHHVEGATARHDRVAWAFASVASQRGVDLFQHTPVTAIVRDGDRVIGVETPRGPIAAGAVLSAAGGRVTPGRGDGRRASAGPDPSAPRVRDQRLRAGLPDHPGLAPSSSATPRRRTAARCSSAPSSTRSPPIRASRHSRAALVHLQDHPAAAVPARRCASFATWAGICDISVDFSPIMSATGSTASSSRPAGERGASRPSRPVARGWPS